MWGLADRFGDVQIMSPRVRKTLKERIPEVEEVVAVTPEQEPLTTAGAEEAGEHHNRAICCRFLSVEYRLNHLVVVYIYIER